ncbi:hypothetical protein RHGRI_008441 [Rhododendron griersonianum]|uniref:AP2/ERF domain-containing protein n=1 Tax=Rhododendron griersonianum TaxID=479676 RepID=A0AAV6L0V7_9ERIC|nr:hypothetical protein RHGRI_008441 [Rhododendron griersonianum]
MANPANVRPSDRPPPKEVKPPTTTAPSPREGSGMSGKHLVFRGIRCRNGKWVSEIREPRKATRIWLGTYPTPETAAAAYDVAVLALKGPDATLNFPESALWYPIPASSSASDIRDAAAAAAAARQHLSMQTRSGSEDTSQEGATSSGGGQEFFDEEEVFDMPNLMAEMAEGMLLSPPRMEWPSTEESAGNSDGERLWSYP